MACSGCQRRRETIAGIATSLVGKLTIITGKQPAPAPKQK